MKKILKILSLVLVLTLFFCSISVVADPQLQVDTGEQFEPQVISPIQGTLVNFTLNDDWLLPGTSQTFTPVCTPLNAANTARTDFT